MKENTLRVTCLIAALALLLFAAAIVPLETRSPYSDVIATTERPAPDQIQAGAPVAPPPPDTGTATRALAQPDSNIQSIADPVPRTGDQSLLVVLVDFPDRIGLFTGREWWQFFFGIGGFAEYFEETSNSLLHYTGDVVGLKNGSPAVNSPDVAYVRLPNPITYYANGRYGFTYGVRYFPANNGGVVYHALQALDAAGFDFSPYADSATNKVENLVVVFAGSNYRYAQDPINSLEATGYRLTSAGGRPYTSTGGQIFDNYTFCPDQGRYSGRMAYIGICAHEQGHALGMLDLYDRSLTTSGIGRFGLMGYGTYGATHGRRPFHPSAFSKEFFGWITPTVVTTGTTIVTLGPAESGTNPIKLHPYGDTNSQEYFLLENRQPVGFDQDWLTSSLCAGLLIWHIDQNIVQNYPYHVNRPPSAGGPPHQGVILVEADGRFDLINPLVRYNYGECSDTWGPDQIWNTNSTPDSRLWDGRSSGISVTVLSQSNNSVELLISVDRLVLPFKAYLPVIER